MIYYQIVLRTTFFYFILILIMRLMGKREIGELSIFDIIVFFIISELLSISIENIEDSIMTTLIPIILITFLQLLTSFICYKSGTIRNLIEGKPDIIIVEGKIIIENMKKQRYNLDDLLTQLHEKDIQTPNQVRFALLESSGRLTVFKKSECDLKWPLPIIKDGKFEVEVGVQLNYSKDKIEEEIKQRGIKNISDVMLCFVKDDGLSIQTFS